LLRQAGVSREEIGLASLLAIPWAAKALWAPFVDGVGVPRQWILGLQATSVLLCTVLALLQPGEGHQLLFAAVLLTNLVAATQDIATDGLAVQMLSDEERGRGNGVQVAGYRVGMILGGAGLLVLYDYVGWRVTMASMAGLLAMSTWPLWSAPEVGAARSTPPDEPLSGHLWSWLALPGALSWALVLCAFKFGDYLGQGMLRPWMVDAGMSTAEIGTLLGVGGFGAGLVGALVGGVMIAPLGLKRALVAGGILQTTGVASYWWVIAAQHTGAGLWVAVVYEHFVGGVATVALFTAMMQASRRAHAATDYTLQASIVVLASGGAAAMSGIVAEQLDYDGLYGLAVVLSMLAPLLAAWPRCGRMVWNSPAEDSEVS
jgi:PAT family beta-lactamase induction signal transducer AmpG